MSYPQLYKSSIFKNVSIYDNGVTRTRVHPPSSDSTFSRGSPPTGNNLHEFGNRVSFTIGSRPATAATLDTNPRLASTRVSHTRSAVVEPSPRLQSTQTSHIRQSVTGTSPSASSISDKTAVGGAYLAQSVVHGIAQQASIANRPTPGNSPAVQNTLNVLHPTAPAPGGILNSRDQQAQNDSQLISGLETAGSVALGALALI